ADAEGRARRDAPRRIDRERPDRVVAFGARFRRSNRFLRTGALFLVVGKISLTDFGCVPVVLDTAVLEPQRGAAELLHVIHAVRAEQQRAAAGEIILHPGDALLLERLVADR